MAIVIECFDVKPKGIYVILLEKFKRVQLKFISMVLLI